MRFSLRTIPNALGALGRVVRRALFESEPVHVPLEQYDRRMHICDKCDRLVKDSRQCMECTCFVDLKAMLSTEHCPLKRW